MDDDKQFSLVVANTNNSLTKASSFIQITNKLLAGINKIDYDSIDLVDLLANKSKKDVYGKFGEPTINKNNSETFFKHGLVFKFTKQDSIKSISATKLSNGVTYPGKLIYKIGDDVTKIQWQVQAEHKNDYVHSKTIILQYGEFILEVEVCFYSEFARKKNPEFLESLIGNNHIQRIELRRIGEIESSWTNINFKANRTIYLFHTYLNKTWRGKIGKLTNAEIDDLQKIKWYLQNKPSTVNQVLRYWQNEHIYYASNEESHQKEFKNHMIQLDQLVCKYFLEEIKDEL